jgi:hypothetical protein
LRIYRRSEEHCENGKKKLTAEPNMSGPWQNSRIFWQRRPSPSLPGSNKRRVDIPTPVGHSSPASSSKFKALPLEDIRFGTALAKIIALKKRSQLSMTCSLGVTRTAIV